MYSLEADTLFHFLARAVGVLLIVEVLLASWQVIYNVYFHPLAGLPGHYLARASLSWRFWHTTRGKIHAAIERQHHINGPVIRVAPNELSFASVKSWNDIYGFPPNGRPHFTKSDFYDMYGSGFDSTCIGSERDPSKHSRMKRSLVSAFSTRSLTEHEPLVQKSIDQFIEKIRKLGNEPGGMDMTDWYEMVAFDILGEMAFGESFNSVVDEHPHFWSQLIEKHLFYVTMLDNLRRYPWVKAIGQMLLPRFTTSIRNQHTKYTRDKVEARLNSKTERPDILTNLVRKFRDGTVPKEELTAHSSTLVIAGGETVATFLSAATFLLLSNPSTLAKLQKEVREHFPAAKLIDSRSALQLPYLNAVIFEALRMYPPGSQGFPRVSPGAFVDGLWVPQGIEVYTSAWTVTHANENFKNPYEFRPERWTSRESSDVKEASQPFSLGPRGCLGRNFAQMEIALILAKTIWTFDAHLVDQGQDWIGKSRLHVMWFKPELRVRWTPRIVRESENLENMPAEQ